jgi:hypothetical protein
VAACRLCNHQRHRRNHDAPDPKEWQQEVRAMIMSGTWHSSCMHSPVLSGMLWAATASQCRG